MAESNYQPPHSHRIQRLGLQFLCVMIATVLPLQQALARSLIRDAETEHFIREVSEPVFAAAGLKPNAVSISIVKASSINVFVVGDQNVFIHSGTIQKADTPNEIIGVMAHVTGHITSGHASAPSGSPSRFHMQQASAAQAALSLLERTGQSGRGLVNFFGKLADQAVLSPQSQDPDALALLMSPEGISALEKRVADSPYRDAPDPEAWQEMLELVQAKLHGFFDHPQVTLRRYPENNQNKAARYARAIAYSRVLDVDRSGAEIDALIADYPGNAFFHEFKGQTLFESGRAAESVAAYRVADQLRPGDPLIMAGLGKALLATDEDANVDEAKTILERAARLERD